MDFTLTTYQKLLNTLKNQGYTFQRFADAIEKPRANTIILRHDVDLHPENALRTAKIEHSLSIRSTYFFRIIPETFKPEIIQRIANLGHEIGYHYEDMTLAAGSGGRRQFAGGNRQAAADSGDSRQYAGGSIQAADNREEVSSRKYEVETHGRASVNKGRNAIHRVLNAIKSKTNKFGTGAEGFPFRGPRGARGEEVSRDEACLVSSPSSCLVSVLASRLVTRLFRKKTNTPENKNTLIDHAYQLFRHHLEQLRQYADIRTICMHGSPKSRYDSKDIWEKYNYRELGIIGEPYFDIDFDEVFYLTDTGRRWDGWKVSLRDKVPQQERWAKQGLVFHSTKDIIKAAEKNQLPGKIMITTHPQRWTDKPLPWVKEFVWQRMKNVGKYFLVKRSAGKMRVGALRG